MSQTSKKIDIPPVKETPEQLLAKVPKVSVTKPKKKETRGRPRKKAKPKWGKGTQYSDHLIAKGINVALLAFVNTVMVKENPLKEDDSMVGEASVYLMDYYGLTPDHPIAIFMVATGLFTKKVIDHKLQTAKAKKKLAGIPKERTEKVA